eukprot:gene7851-1057_t
MAFADIPPAMRPVLSEFDPVGSLLGMGGLGAIVGGGGGMGPVRPARLESLKALLLKSLTALRAMDKMLGEKHNVNANPEYRRSVDGIHKQLSDAVNEIDAMLSDVQAAGPPSPGPRSKAHGGGGGGGNIEPVDGDANFLADAVADELRERLRELARQVADLQVDVIQRDENIKSLISQRDELERKYGVPTKDRMADYIPRSDYEDLGSENSSLKEQLVYCLEELAARERELAEMNEACNRHATKMQTFSDQVKMVYRDYATSLGAWKVEKRIMEKRIKKLQEDADGYKASTNELTRGLEAVSNAHTTTDIQKEYIGTVRRMALVQIKHSKIVRELEGSIMGEKAASERVDELEEEVRDIGSTCRARMRWLEATGDQSSRRVAQLFRELEGSVPLPAYHMLVAKHTRLQTEVRRQVEEIGDSVLAMDEVVRLRDELAELMVRYDRASDDNAALREKCRQMEVYGGILGSAGTRQGGGAFGAPPHTGGGYPGISTSTLHPGGQPHHTNTGYPNNSAMPGGGNSGYGTGTNAYSSTPYGGGSNGSYGSGGGPGENGSGGQGASTARDLKFLEKKLSQELIASKVVQESSARRLELVESERDRIQKSLQEAQEAQVSFESSARGLELVESERDRIQKSLQEAQIGFESSARRLELIESEQDRIQKYLQEAQARMKEIEVRLGQNAGELDLCRSSAADLELRLEGSKPKVEVDQLMHRLMEAEEAASRTHSNVASMTYRVEDAERRLQVATRDRQRHLADITNLRAALRDAMAKNDQAAIIGKLHLEIDHCRAKESLVRNALNRSEAERVEIEKELRRLRSDTVRLNGRCVAHQDQARWADKQRHEAHAQLDMSLAGRTEQWKAQLYARKLEQLKTRNDAIADSLDLARRRIKKLEDMKVESEAKLSLTEKDAIADSLDLARRSIKKLEGMKEESKAKLSLTENDAIADTLDIARRSIKKLEGMTEESKAKLGLTENYAIADSLDLARRHSKKLEGMTEESKAKLGLTENDAIADSLDLARRHSKKLGGMTAESKAKISLTEVHYVERVNVELYDLQEEYEAEVHYVERVNAELHELLEKYEAEFFSNQLHLEADKQAAYAQARMLQDEMSKLQERLTNVLAGQGGDTGDLKSGNPLRVSVDAGKRLKGMMASHTQSDREMMLKRANSSRMSALSLTAAELNDQSQQLQNKISLKAAELNDESQNSIDEISLTTAELNDESQKLQNELSLTTAELNDVRRHHNDALERLKDQSIALMSALDSQKIKQQDETVVEQMKAVTEATINKLKNRIHERDLRIAHQTMKAVAEATINELKSRIHERDLRIAASLKTLEEGKKEWLAQHAHDRQEIERLNQKLFERNDQSIENLKDLLNRLPRGEGDGAYGELQELRDLLDRKQSEIHMLKNQLDQKDAAMDRLSACDTMEVLRQNYEMQSGCDAMDFLRQNFEVQLRKLETEIARLQAELDRPRDDGPSKALVAKLSSQLRQRDASLLKLKEAVKALESRLADKFRREVDEDINGASWKEQERLNDLVRNLEDRERDLMQQLQMARDEAAMGPAGDRAADGIADSLRTQLNSALERNAELEKEFARVRMELQKLKNAESTAVDLASGMTLDGRRQMEELQKRINVLERQNQQLKRTVQQDEDSATGGAPPSSYRPGGGGGGGGDTGDDGGGGPARRPGTAPTRGGPRTKPGPGDPAFDQAVASSVAAALETHQQRSSMSQAKPFDQAVAAALETHQQGSSMSQAKPFDQAVAAALETHQQGSSMSQAKPFDQAVVAALETHQQAASASSASRTAVAQWEESKRLNGRIDDMRKKMIRKGEEVAEAQKGAEKYKAQADKLQVEVDRQAAALRNADERLKRAAAAADRMSSGGGAVAGSSSGGAGPSAGAAGGSARDTAMLRQYVEQCGELERQVEELKVEVARASRRLGSGSAGATTSTDAGAMVDKDAEIFTLQMERGQAQAAATRLKSRITFDAEIFTLQLERDQAQATATRLKSRITQLFGSDAAQQSATVGRGGTRTVKGGITPAREAELLSTINNLKVALEKATSASVQTTKYMAEVTKRKELQKVVAAAKAEMDKLRSQSSTATRMMAELQASNAQLRSQASNAQLRSQVRSGQSNEPRESSVGQQLGALEVMLSQRDEEVRNLKLVLVDMEGRQQEMAGAGDGEALAMAQERMADLEEENRDLRNELNAFDPAFFEEIEDLKHEHYVLSQRVEEQQNTITRMNQRATSQGRA